MDETALDGQLVFRAAEAVAHAARPSLVMSVHARAVSWPTKDRVGDVTVAVADAMLDPVHEARTGPWWLATGETLTSALCVVVDGLDESSASYLIGAALHAHILGGADLMADGVLRLAERAACWRSGATHAAERF